MKIYLAGPMRGIKDFNFPAFFEAALRLRVEGHEVFNPAERDVTDYGAEGLKTETGDVDEVSKKLGFEGLSLARQCFMHDTHYICTRADAVYLLPGWENSKGAKAERALAEAVGLQVVELP